MWTLMLSGHRKQILSLFAVALLYALVKINISLSTDACKTSVPEASEGAALN